MLHGQVLNGIIYKQKIKPAAIKLLNNTEDQDKMFSVLIIYFILILFTFISLMK